MTKTRLINALLVAFVVAASYVGVTIAQSTGTGFVVSPVLDDTTILNPGETVTKTMTVSNPTSTDITVKLVANDFEPNDDESGVPKFDFDGTNSVNYSNKFASLVGELPEVKLDANTDTSIDFDLIAPADANPGGYYGVVRVEPVVVPGEQQLNLAASVGTLFLVTVPGDLTEKLDLVELSPARNDSTQRFFIGGGEDFQIVTRLNNSGNIHSQPFGKVNISDSDGNIVESIDFNTGDQKSNVLPDSTRRFVTELDNNYGYGKYTATINFGYGNGGNLITGSTSFWVIPVWMVVVAVVALLAIIIGAFLVYRKLNKTRKHKVKPRR